MFTLILNHYLHVLFFDGKGKSWYSFFTTPEPSSSNIPLVFSTAFIDQDETLDCLRLHA